MKSSNFRALTLCTVVAAGLLAPAAFADTFTESYSLSQFPVSPHYESFDNAVNGSSSFVTNFNGSSVTGTYTTTYSGGLSFYQADLYGGAGGTGKYLVTQDPTSGPTATTLKLSQQVTYFGLWFSALDAGNILTFYDTAVSTTVPVFTFTPTDFINGVGVCTSSDPYCGNPNTNFLHQDPSQQYAYINLTDTTGTFNEVVFSQDPSQPYGRFEADNNAIEITAPGTTPEPSSLVLLGTGITAMAGVVRRRIRK